MKKKIGPLEAWQWAAVTVAVVLLYYVYRRHSTSSASPTLTPTTPPDPNASGNDSSAGAGSSGGPDPNLIDPTTGMPLLGEINQGLAGVSAGLASLQQSQADEAAILETAFASLQSQGAAAPGVVAASVMPLVTPDGPANVVPVSMATAKAGQSAGEKAAEKAKRSARELKKTAAAAAPRHEGGTTNPGHHVTTSPLGSTAASAFSRAAESVGKAVAPPQHQKAPEPPKTFMEHLPLIHGKTTTVTVPHSAIPVPASVAPASTPHPAFVAVQNLGRALPSHPNNAGAGITAPPKARPKKR